MNGRRSGDEDVLLQRCAGGEGQACATLCRRYEADIRSFLRGWMRHRGAIHEDLIDDAVQDLWCALCNREGDALRRYNSARGALGDFLIVVALDHLRDRLRAEDRRHRREECVARRVACDPAGEWEEIEVELAEIVQQLSPRERDFCQGYLLGWTEAENGLGLSDDNIRKLTSRVRWKVLAYLDRLRSEG